MELTEFVVLLLLTTTAVLAVAPTAEAIWMEVPSSGTKCVSEEIHSNVVVLADYNVIGDEEHAQANVVPTISVKVTSPFGNNLYHKENVTHGQFAFTTTEAGNYLACFWMDNRAPGAKGVTIGVDWKTGISAKDWESVARKEKIEGIELELVKLEGIVQAIQENLEYLKHREAEMREDNEETNARVAWLSIMSLSICLAVAALQLCYLKSYFRKKKLI
ncbi:transmembrane emp24 domain-containing protein p24delta3-like [Nicotiana tabacum]|uniref:Transmembrane emp24 domain-containing protein p24delta3-like n=1 Tax=Nicotiana tabacum TaxID=4097 RepID=A0A1S4AIA9_TOBAC|nr:PREDICTED: transmembrane emp24 domain-containing protein p24delta3-like [Nicotiana tabacum]